MDAVPNGFRRAIETYAVDGLELLVDEEVLRKLRARVRRGRLVLLGEAHAVDENAALAYALMTLLGLRGLALEWSSVLSGLVERFLETDQLDLELEPEQLRQVERFIAGNPIAVDDTLDRALAFFTPDGRVTAGTFALLRRLREQALLEQPILFAAGGRTWSERDAAMAAGFLNAWDGKTPLLMIAGNAHTPRHEHQLGRPMGAHIANAVPEAVEVTIDYLSGGYYNFGHKRFDAGRQTGEEHRPRLQRQSDDVYAIEIANVRIATVAEPEPRSAPR